MGTGVAAVLLGGLICSALLAGVAVLLPAAIAQVLPTLLRRTLLLSLPLALSAALVNVFFVPGAGTVIATVGPLSATAEGLAYALEIVARVMVIAGAGVLFYLTTRPSELVVDLERRGVPPSLSFVIHNAIAMLPRTAERASQVADAQRARGLDTESSPWRRLRGVAALAAPTVLGAIEEGEVRALALEARAFARPGPRTLLWAPRDRAPERLARWAMVLGVGLLAVARLAGVPLPC